ncbi:MAG: alanine dehydrogenase [Gammaproteobacteria bacterium]|nr:alanine dehydrogenase [Gammaproteobacteria bacterium]
MRIGIPKEVKTQEGRVALIPAAVAELIYEGHELIMQAGAGELSGYPDEAFSRLGARIVPDARALYEGSELIVKVKEPQPEELERLRSDHRLFCYLHLAAEPELTRALLDIGLTAVGFETVTAANGHLPLLAPMSEIAGRIAVQVGSHYLYQPTGGRGVLLGGIASTTRGKVVILGAGMAGRNAAALAVALGANVTVFDTNMDKLAAMHELGANVTALYPYADSLQAAVVDADLLIGAVLIPGARAPHLVNADTVREMKAGSVIIDISVDQGGCIETTRPTSYADPVFTWEGVVHFGVTNMPGAVPRTSSQAISAALIPYVKRIARDDWQQDAGLKAGINVMNGAIVHPALK